MVVIYVGLCDQVEELDGTKPGPQLYGFYKSPPLDVVTTWSESYSVSVPANSHKASLILDNAILPFCFNDALCLFLKF